MTNLLLKIGLICFLLVSFYGFGQKPVKIERFTEKKYGKLRLDVDVVNPIYYGIDDLSEPDINAIVFEMAGSGPYADDKARNTDLQLTDSTMATLAQFANLERVKTFVFYIGEGKFLKATDNLIPETEEYNKNQGDLNYDRFVERYQAIITETFKGKRVIYVEWGW